IIRRMPTSFGRIRAVNGPASGLLGFPRTLSSQGGRMDAIQFLKQEHQKAKSMFARIEQAGGSERGQLWKKLGPELKAHEHMEEQHVCGPVAREAGGRGAELREWEKHHHEEVGKAESMIKKLDSSDASGDAWLSQLRELKGALEHHIQEEEGRIFPKIQQVWDGGKLQQAGQQLEGAAKKAQQAA